MADIVAKPARRLKSERRFHIGKFHLNYHESQMRARENIELCHKGIVEWDTIAGLGENDAVALGKQTVITLGCESELLFAVNDSAWGGDMLLDGEDEVVAIAAHSDSGRSGQIALLYDSVGIGVEIVGKTAD